MQTLEDSQEKLSNTYLPNLETEFQLVLRARQGEEVAFAELVKIYWQPIYLYLLRLTNQNELAADLTQETFCKAYQAITTLPANNSLQFRPWLYRIATNLTITEARRKKTLGWLSLEKLTFSNRLGEKEGTVFSSQAGRLLEDQHLSPSDIALANEKSREVVTALNKLPTDQAALLLLRFYQELSYEELAQVLDIKVDAVRARLHRARQAFSRIFNQLQEHID